MARGSCVFNGAARRGDGREGRSGVGRSGAHGGARRNRAQARAGVGGAPIEDAVHVEARERALKRLQMVERAVMEQSESGHWIATRELTENAHRDELGGAHRAERRDRLREGR